MLLNLDCLLESFDNIGVVKLGPVLCIGLLCMGLTSVLTMDLLRPVLCIGLCCALVCVVHWSVTSDDIIQSAFFLSFFFSRANLEKLPLAFDVSFREQGI